MKDDIDHGDSSMTEAKDGKGGQKTEEGDVHPASAGLGLRLRLLFGHEEDVADKRIIPISFLSHRVGFEATLFKSAPLKNVHFHVIIFYILEYNNNNKISIGLYKRM